MLIAFVLLRETNLLDILRHVDRLSNLAATRNLEELSGVARHAVVGLADLGPNFAPPANNPKGTSAKKREK
jgi:hypothetical protein